MNASALPGSPLSVTWTVKLHGTPFSTHVPAKLAVVSPIDNELKVTLLSLSPVE
jgi:hypothetical protein